MTDHLKDNDPMPFGKYAGQPMVGVPAHYLHWLWNNGKKDQVNCPVHRYIKRCLGALKKELPDAVWEQAGESNDSEH